MLLAVALCLVLPPSTRAQDAGSATSACPLGLDAYRGSILRNVTVRPFLPLPGASVSLPSLPFLRRPLDSALRAAQDRLRGRGTRFEAGVPFTPEGMSLLSHELTQELGDQRLRSSSGLLYVEPRLRHCDDRAEPRTVDVELRVFSVSPPTYLARTFEARDGPDAETEAVGRPAKFRLQPFLGYNDSRGVHGGGRFSFLGESRFVDRVDLQGSASGNSSDVDLGIAGSRQFSRGALEYATWRLGYTRSDMPGGSIRLTDEAFRAQLFGASRAIEPMNLVLRLGGMLEGGRRESNVPAADLPADTLQSSDYGALKLFVGGSGNHGRHEWKASYGLQLGSTLERAGLDYHRHIVDTAYRARFLPRPHLPFQLDVQFTGGFLGSLGGNMPAGERFFGGNAERYFVQDDGWRIRSNPYIRSFAQNRFNDVDGRKIGGDRFASLNLTIAQTVWSRPLVPPDIRREVVRDPTIVGALGGQLIGTRVILREDSIQSTSREQKELSESVQGLAPVLARLEGAIESLRSIAEYEGLVGEVLSHVEAAKESVEGARPPEGQPAEPVVNQLPANLVEVKAVDLARGDPDVEVAAQLTSLESAVKALGERAAQDGRMDAAARLAEIARAVTIARQLIDERLGRLQRLRAYDLKALGTVLGPLRAVLGPLGSTASSRDGPTLPAIRRELDQILMARKAAGLPGECVPLLETAIGFLDKAASAVQEAVEKHEARDSSATKNAIDRAVVGFGGIPSLLGALVAAIGDLPGTCPGDDLTQRWVVLERGAREVSEVRARARTAVMRLPVSPYEAEANKTVDYIGRIVDVFFNELNLVSVSPVLMLDVASIGSKHRAIFDDPRYGVGLGLRLGLVNVDLTFGYSVNPEPRRGEARGTFVFLLTINDLFR